MRIHETEDRPAFRRALTGWRRLLYSCLVPDTTQSKRELLAAELQRYFGETCPALAARWQAAITGLTPPVLRDLARRLQELETITKETNRQLRATLRLPTAKDAVSTEPALDHALASLERLDEIAESIMRRLDELDA